MSRVEVTQETTPLSDGILKTDLPLDGTLQVVKDQLNNSSTLLLATDETQVNSVLRINTDASELLDLQDTGSNNRFNINRDVQKINLDFASKPSDITTQVGAIRTAQDGVNLSDAVKFQENGQVTFTERVKIESDSTVSTQTSSVIQATTTNASLVLSPNGTGAIIASVPDGTATGGNARGAYAVDLQMSRSANTQVASSPDSVITGGSNNSIFAARAVICGGLGNSVSSGFGVVSGGQSNTASTNTHATVVGGLSNTASGQYSVVGGRGSTASNQYSIAIGPFHNSSGNSSVAIGYGVASSGNTSVGIGSTLYPSADYSTVFGYQQSTYLYGQLANGNGYFGIAGDAMQSLLTARRSTTLTTGATTVLSLDGTGTTNLIIPNGNNRMWNVQVAWVAVVTAITGTATGVTVGDTKTSTDLLGVAKRGGVTTVSAHTSAGTHAIETLAGSLTAANITYSAGASQEMAITFTGPTFVGGGSVTMRVVARVQLTEVAY